MVKNRFIDFCIHILGIDWSNISVYFSLWILLIRRIVFLLNIFSWPWLQLNIDEFEWKRFSLHKTLRIFHGFCNFLHCKIFIFVDISMNFGILFFKCVTIVCSRIFSQSSISLIISPYKNPFSPKNHDIFIEDLEKSLKKTSIYKKDPRTHHAYVCY